MARTGSALTGSEGHGEARMGPDWQATIGMASQGMESNAGEACSSVGEDGEEQRGSNGEARMARPAAARSGRQP